MNNSIHETLDATMKALDIHRLKNSGDQLSEAICTEKKNLSELRAQSDSIDLQVENIKAQTDSEVSNETNEAGKPAFGNETARKAEAMIRLSKNQDYQKLLDQQRETRKNLAQLHADIEKLENEFLLIRLTMQAGV